MYSAATAEIATCSEERLAKPNPSKYKLKYSHNALYWAPWAQFCCKMWGDSLVWNQYSHQVDAEVTFCIYRFLNLFPKGVSRATLITFALSLQKIYMLIYLNLLLETVL